jgi:hypothetical protein
MLAGANPGVRASLVLCNDAMSDIPVELWRWVRHEMPHDAFGWWLYDHSDAIAAALPKHLAAELIGLDFWPSPVTGSDAERMRARLAVELPRRCACHLMLDRQRLPLGIECLPEKYNEAFETLAKHTPWLELSRCRRCGQHWYVACDTTDDYWYFERVEPSTAERILGLNQWPTTFDGWAHVWPEGAQLGTKRVLIDEFHRGIINDFISGLSTR